MINNGHVANIDPKLMPLIKSTNAQVDVLPLVNNFDPIVNEWRTRHRADAGFKGMGASTSARR